MANKYLDNAGLDHMWDKIKAYLGDSYATKSHTHTIAQIIDLQMTLNGKANSSHTHTANQITDLKSNSIRPLNTEGTSRSLPAINIGEMKAINAETGYNSGENITLPSGGIYLCLSVSSIPIIYGGVKSGGATVGTPRHLSGTGGYYAARYYGFYIRLS